MLYLLAQAEALKAKTNRQKITVRYTRLDISQQHNAQDLLLLLLLLLLLFSAARV
jgi:hypothetical protein